MRALARGPVAGTIFLAVVAWLLAVSACDPALEDSPCGQTTDPPDHVDGGLVCDQPFHMPAAGEPPARFAVKVVQYLHVNAAGIVETDTMGAAIGYADFAYDPASGSGTMALKMCYLDVPKMEIPGQPEPTVFTLSAETFEKIAPSVTPFTLQDERTCAAVVTGPAVVLVAARLADTLLDPLPDDPDHETCPGPEALGCLYDVDQDLKPAATVGAENVPGLPVDEVYATLRAWVSFDGLVGRDDLMLGTAHFGLDMATVGCRIEPLGGGDKRDCNGEELDVLKQITPTFDPTPGMDSTFMAVRVAADTDCQTVIEQADLLFGR